jgi:hypothetical protein
MIEIFMKVCKEGKHIDDETMNKMKMKSNELN